MSWRLAVAFTAAVLAGACTDSPTDSRSDDPGAYVAEPKVSAADSTVPPQQPDERRAVGIPVLRTNVPPSWQQTADRMLESMRGLELVRPDSDAVVIEFEEDSEAAHIEAEWNERLVDSPRVSQTDEDIKGAPYYLHRSPFAYLEGRLFDMCRFEDAATIWGKGGPDPDRIPQHSPEERAVVEWEVAIRYDCRDSETASKQPAPNRSRARWSVFNARGQVNEFFTSAEEALDAYRGSIERPDRPFNTVPDGAILSGFRDDTSGRFGILYSDAADPVDEVRVLTDTVLVRDGTLRGLMRNWSRELWAYSTEITADGQSWHWSLSIQPGQVAPFEIEGWEGPTDPARIMFDITAEMSDDADLARARLVTPPSLHSGIRAEEYHEEMPSEISDLLSPRGAVILNVLTGGVNDLSAGSNVLLSHPGSVHYWRLEKDYPVSAWVAWISHGDGRVVEIDQLVLFDNGWRQDHRIEPFVITEWPHPEHGDVYPMVAFDHTAPTALGTETGHIAWAGFAYSRAFSR